MLTLHNTSSSLAHHHLAQSALSCAFLPLPGVERTYRLRYILAMATNHIALMM